MSWFVYLGPADFKRTPPDSHSTRSTHFNRWTRNKKTRTESIEHRVYAPQSRALLCFLGFVAFLSSFLAMLFACFSSFSPVVVGGSVPRPSSARSHLSPLPPSRPCIEKKPTLTDCFRLSPRRQYMPPPTPLIPHSFLVRYFHAPGDEIFLVDHHRRRGPRPVVRRRRRQRLALGGLALMLGETLPDGEDAVDDDGVDAFFDLALFTIILAQVLLRLAHGIHPLQRWDR